MSDSMTLALLNILQKNLRDAVEKVEADLPDNMKIVVPPMFNLPGMSETIIYPVLDPIHDVLNSIDDSIDILKGKTE